jgi:hypothetical protein
MIQHNTEQHRTRHPVSFMSTTVRGRRVVVLNLEGTDPVAQLVEQRTFNSSHHLNQHGTTPHYTIEHGAQHSRTRTEKDGLKCTSLSISCHEPRSAYHKLASRFSSSSWSLISGGEAS